MRYAFIVACLYSLCVQPSLAQSVADYSSPDLVAEAKRRVGDYLVSIQTFQDQSVVYSGSYISVMGDGATDGTYPFTGFWASDSKARERFWLIRKFPSVGLQNKIGESIDLLRDGNSDFVSLVAGHRVELDEDTHEMWLKRYARIAPVAAPLCYPAGVLRGHTVIQPTRYAYAAQRNVVGGRKLLHDFMAILEVPDTDFWLHLLFSKANGMQPTLTGFTPRGEHLDISGENALMLARTSWSRDSRGDWLPIAGENTFYHGGTPKGFKFVDRLQYKCVWLSDSDLPVGTFSKELVDCDPVKRLSAASELITRLAKLKHVNE